MSGRISKIVLVKIVRTLIPEWKLPDDMAFVDKFLSIFPSFMGDGSDMLIFIKFCGMITSGKYIFINNDIIPTKPNPLSDHDIRMVVKHP